MLSASGWKKNQANTILFVLLDTDAVELVGRGDNFNVFVSKAGAAFVPGIGSKGEIGLGWYYYTASPSEADTSGPVAVVVQDTGIIQQNLEYVVDDRVITAVEFTYTLTSTAGNTPVAGAKIDIYVDSLAQAIAWSGMTDAFGVARDEYGSLPRLEPGTYYIWRTKPGFSASNPDIEVVS